MRTLLPRLLLVCSVASPLWPGDYWVSPNGLDSNPGTAELPWSLAKAATAAPAGAIVHLTAGVYASRLVIRVSGDATAGWTAFVGDPGAIIDGSSIPAPIGGWQGLVEINGCTYVRVEGLEIRNWKTSAAGSTPAGILVRSQSGPCHHLQIVRNHVHDIWQQNQNDGAHGIAVYGDSATPVTDLLIRANEVDHCQLAWSEALVANGNIDGFEIVGNTVHHNNNIGIVLIGYEGTAPVNDIARNGNVHDNIVYAIHTAGYDTMSRNLAYAPGQDSAGGIYVDGGHESVLQRNLTWDCDIGIEVGAEHNGDRNAINITVQDNVIHTTIQGGIMFGGYAANLSYADSCRFLHNTIYNADIKHQGFGCIGIQKSRNCVVRNNMLVASGGNSPYVLSSSMTGANILGNSYDYNFFWSLSGQPIYQTDSVASQIGLRAHQEASGQDAHSREADPKLTSLSGTIDLHPLPDSSAIDAGDPGFMASAGETDCDGSPRIIGAATDIGAYEYAATGSTGAGTTGGGTGTVGMGTGGTSAIGATSAPPTSSHGNCGAGSALAAMGIAIAFVRNPRRRSAL